MNQTPETDPRPAGWMSNRLGLAALAVAAVALVASLAPYATGGDFDGRVRAYLLKHPEVLQEVSTALQQKQEEERVVAVNARAQTNPGLLAVDPRDPTFGPSDAKVTVIEFFDYQCPGCKATAPEVLALVQANPDVRFVFKDWPILDRGDPSGPSHYAALASQAAHQQGKYLPVFRAIMAQGDLTPETIDAILVANGVDLNRAKAEMQSAETARHLAVSQTSAAALGLYGTPTFFVNGRASPTIEPAAIARQIQAAKARG